MNESDEQNKSNWRIAALWLGDINVSQVARDFRCPNPRCGYFACVVVDGRIRCDYCHAFIEMQGEALVLAADHGARETENERRRKEQDRLEVERRVRVGENERLIPIPQDILDQMPTTTRTIEDLSVWERLRSAFSGWR